MDNKLTRGVVNNDSQKIIVIPIWIGKHGWYSRAFKMHFFQNCIWGHDAAWPDSMPNFATPPKTPINLLLQIFKINNLTWLLDTTRLLYSPALRTLKIVMKELGNMPGKWTLEFNMWNRLNAIAINCPFNSINALLQLVTGTSTMCYAGRWNRMHHGKNVPYDWPEHFEKSAWESKDL